MLNSIEVKRVRNRLTKEELAKKLGVSVKTYYNWINEETDMPITKLVTLSCLFGTSIDYLLYNTGEYTLSTAMWANAGVGITPASLFAVPQTDVVYIHIDIFCSHRLRKNRVLRFVHQVDYSLLQI